MLGAALGANDGRADHMRATLRRGPGGALIATAFPVQDSAMLRRLAQADALILRAPHAPALPEGADGAAIDSPALNLASLVRGRPCRRYAAMSQFLNFLSLKLDATARTNIERGVVAGLF